ncbi:hypothetical protein SNK21_25840, partial [Ralstonia pseudosolanacearum]
MRPRIEATGHPVARELRDGSRVKVSTFIPLKIRKRGASKVVVRPSDAPGNPGKATGQPDRPLLVAL